MTDVQFGALLAVLGTFGTGLLATIRWAVTRITTALDTNTASHFESAKAMTAMSTKLDFVYGVSREVKDEITGNHDKVDLGDGEETPLEKPQRHQTPRGGAYFQKRGQTKG